MAEEFDFSILGKLDLDAIRSEVPELVNILKRAGDAAGNAFGQSLSRALGDSPLGDLRDGMVRDAQQAGVFAADQFVKNFKNTLRSRRKSLESEISSLFDALGRKADAGGAGPAAPKAASPIQATAQLDLTAIERSLEGMRSSVSRVEASSKSAAQAADQAANALSAVATAAAKVTTGLNSLADRAGLPAGRTQAPASSPTPTESTPQVRVSRSAPAEREEQEAKRVSSSVANLSQVMDEAAARLALSTGRLIKTLERASETKTVKGDPNVANAIGEALERARGELSATIGKSGADPDRVQDAIELEAVSDEEVYAAIRQATRDLVTTTKDLTDKQRTVADALDDEARAAQEAAELKRRRNDALRLQDAARAEGNVEEERRQQQELLDLNRKLARQRKKQLEAGAEAELRQSGAAVSTRSQAARAAREGAELRTQGGRDVPVGGGGGTLKGVTGSLGSAPSVGGNERRPAERPFGGRITDAGERIGQLSRFVESLLSSSSGPGPGAKLFELTRPAALGVTTDARDELTTNLGLGRGGSLASILPGASAIAEQISKIPDLAAQVLGPGHQGEVNAKTVLAALDRTLQARAVPGEGETGGEAGARAIREILGQLTGAGRYASSTEQGAGSLRNVGEALGQVLTEGDRVDPKRFKELTGLEANQSNVELARDALNLAREVADTLRSTPEAARAITDPLTGEVTSGGLNAVISRVIGESVAAGAAGPGFVAGTAVNVQARGRARVSEYAGTEEGAELFSAISRIGQVTQSVPESVKALEAFRADAQRVYDDPELSSRQRESERGRLIGEARLLDERFGTSIGQGDLGLDSLSSLPIADLVSEGDRATLNAAFAGLAELADLGVIKNELAEKVAAFDVTAFADLANMARDSESINANFADPESEFFDLRQLARQNFLASQEAGRLAAPAAGIGDLFELYGPDVSIDRIKQTQPALFDPGTREGVGDQRRVLEQLTTGVTGTLGELLGPKAEGLDAQVAKVTNGFREVDANLDKVSEILSQFGLSGYDPKDVARGSKLRLEQLGALSGSGQVTPETSSLASVIAESNRTFGLRQATSGASGRRTILRSVLGVLQRGRADARGFVQNAGFDAVAGGVPIEKPIGAAEGFPLSQQQRDEELRRAGFTGGAEKLQSDIQAAVSSLGLSGEAAEKLAADMRDLSNQYRENLIIESKNLADALGTQEDVFRELGETSVDEDGRFRVEGVTGEELIRALESSVVRDESGNVQGGIDLQKFRDATGFTLTPEQGAALLESRQAVEESGKNFATTARLAEAEYASLRTTGSRSLDPIAALQLLDDRDFGEETRDVGGLVRDKFSRAGLVDLAPRENDAPRLQDAEARARASKELDRLSAEFGEGEVSLKRFISSLLELGAKMDVALGGEFLGLQRDEDPRQFGSDSDLKADPVLRDEVRQGLFENFRGDLGSVTLNPEQKKALGLAAYGLRGQEGGLSGDDATKLAALDRILGESRGGKSVGLQGYSLGELETIQGVLGSGERELRLDPAAASNVVRGEAEHLLAQANRILQATTAKLGGVGGGASLDADSVLANARTARLTATQTSEPARAQPIPDENIARVLGAVGGLGEFEKALARVVRLTHRSSPDPDNKRPGTGPDNPPAFPDVDDERPAGRDPYRDASGGAAPQRTHEFEAVMGPLKAAEMAAGTLRSGGVYDAARFEAERRKESPRDNSSFNVFRKDLETLLTAAAVVRPDLYAEPLAEVAAMENTADFRNAAYGPDYEDAIASGYQGRPDLAITAELLRDAEIGALSLAEAGQLGNKTPAQISALLEAERLATLPGGQEPLTPSEVRKAYERGRPASGPADPSTDPSVAGAGGHGDAAIALGEMLEGHLRALVDCCRDMRDALLRGQATHGPAGGMANPDVNRITAERALSEKANIREFDHFREAADQLQGVLSPAAFERFVDSVSETSTKQQIDLARTQAQGDATRQANREMAAQQAIADDQARRQREAAGELPELRDAKTSRAAAEEAARRERVRVIAEQTGVTSSVDDLVQQQARVAETLKEQAELKKKIHRGDADAADIAAMNLRLEREQAELLEREVRLARELHQALEGGEYGGTGQRGTMTQTDRNRVVGEVVGRRVDPNELAEGVRPFENSVRKHLFGGDFAKRMLQSTGTFIVRNLSSTLVFGFENMVREMFSAALEAEQAWIRISSSLEFAFPDDSILPGARDTLRTKLQGIATDLGVGLSDVFDTAASLTGVFGGDPESIASATQAVTQLQLISRGALNATEGYKALSAVTTSFYSGISNDSGALSKELEHLSNVVVHLQDALSVNVEDTLEGLASISSLAKNMNIDLELAAVAVAGIAKGTGQSGQAAGEQAGRIFAALQTAGAAKVLRQEAGIDAAALSAGRYGEVLIDLIAKFDDLGVAQRQAVTEVLGGQRQARSINALLGNRQSLEAYADSLDRSKVAERAAERISKIMETLDGQFDRFRANLEAVFAALIDLGIVDAFSSIFGVLNGIIGALGTVASLINDTFDLNGATQSLKTLLGLWLTFVAARGIGRSVNRAAEYSPAAAALAQLPYVLTGHRGGVRDRVSGFGRRAHLRLERGLSAGGGYDPAMGGGLLGNPTARNRAMMLGIGVPSAIMASQAFGRVGKGEGGQGGFDVGSALMTGLVAAEVGSLLKGTKAGGKIGDVLGGMFKRKPRLDPQLDDLLDDAFGGKGKAGRPWTSRGPGGGGGRISRVLSNVAQRFAGLMPRIVRLGRAFMMLSRPLQIAVAGIGAFAGALVVGAAKMAFDGFRNRRRRDQSYVEARNAGLTPEQIAEVEGRAPDDVSDVIERIQELNASNEPRAVVDTDQLGTTGRIKDFFSSDLPRIFSLDFADHNLKSSAATGAVSQFEGAAKSIAADAIKGGLDFDSAADAREQIMAAQIEALKVLERESKAGEVGDNERNILINKIKDATKAELEALEQALGISPTDILFLDYQEAVNSALGSARGLGGTAKAKFGDLFRDQFKKMGFDEEGLIFGALDAELDSNMSEADRARAQIAKAESSIRAFQEVLSKQKMDTEEREAITKQLMEEMAQYDEGRQRLIAALTNEAAAFSQVGTETLNDALVIQSINLERMGLLEQLADATEPAEMMRIQAELAKIGPRIVAASQAGTQRKRGRSLALSQDPQERAILELRELEFQFRTAETAQAKYDIETELMSKKLELRDILLDEAMAMLETARAVSDDPYENARTQLRIAYLQVEQAKNKGVAAQEAAKQQVAEAKRTLRDSLEAVAASVSGVAIAFAEAQGRDVEAARLQMEEARRQLEAAKAFGLGEASINDAYASFIAAQRSFLDARLSESLELIDFNLEMGNLTEQEAIAKLQQVLEDESLTDRQRRDILLKIKGLKEAVGQSAAELTSSGFNIPNEIRLPTAYEVRRSLGVIGIQDAVGQALSDLEDLSAADPWENWEGVTANGAVLELDPSLQLIADPLTNIQSILAEMLRVIAEQAGVAYNESVAEGVAAGGTGTGATGGGGTASASTPEKTFGGPHKTQAEVDAQIAQIIAIYGSLENYYAGLPPLAEAPPSQLPGSGTGGGFQASSFGGSPTTTTTLTITNDFTISGVSERDSAKVADAVATAIKRQASDMQRSVRSNQSTPKLVRLGGYLS